MCSLINIPYHAGLNVNLSIQISNIDWKILTDRNWNQWVDLGDLSPFTCMTLPENCGPDGGALSAWIKLIDCPNNHGFLGSRDEYLTGLKTLCSSNVIRYV